MHTFDPLSGNGSASPDRKASERADSEQARPWANVARDALTRRLATHPREQQRIEQALRDLAALDAAWDENERQRGSAAALERLQAEYLALVGPG